MEALTYTTIDKSTWGDGPWQSEPDKMQWQDEATGLPCLIVRSPHTGALCGYVGVSPAHPAHGLNYDGLTQEAEDEWRLQFKKASKLFARNKSIPETMEKVYGDAPSAEPVPGIGEKVAQLEAHGGLTFSSSSQESDNPAIGICHIAAPGEPDNVWWFGFDCAHAWDQSPGMDATMREMEKNNPSPPELAELRRLEVYRDVPYVQGQVADLAKQLAAIA